MNKERIAIIGSGISGLTCGYLLQKHYQINLFEANDYIGGHTATVPVEVAGKTYAIDTGFIVYNDWTYPNFIKLLEQLGVQTQETQMSFSVKDQARDLEYNGHSLNSLFAQRRNLLRPSFWGMLRDIVRFNKQCKSLAEADAIPDISLNQFITELNLGNLFKHNYLLPMCAAIWSSSTEQVSQFSLPFFIQFFNNHGLLNIQERPQWRTLIGGSNQYVEPMTQGFADSIHLNSPIKAVHKIEEGYRLQLSDGTEQIFDQVIFACHSNQALSCLPSATPAQTEILSAIPYADNEVILHTDTSLLPNRKLAWASWNYLLQGTSGENQAPATLTYNMNILQRIQAPVTFCVTLNHTQAIDPDKILRRFVYAHPQFSQTSRAAQQRRQEICGQDGLHFCGAYWYNGFHEDGVRSALDVCERLGVKL
jgi:predicted NAD/FAD-binding protein